MTIFNNYCSSQKVSEKFLSEFGILINLYNNIKNTLGVSVPSNVKINIVNFINFDSFISFIGSNFFNLFNFIREIKISILKNIFLRRKEDGADNINFQENDFIKVLVKSLFCENLQALAILLITIRHQKSGSSVNKMLLQCFLSSDAVIVLVIMGFKSLVSNCRNCDYHDAEKVYGCGFLLV
uniref:Uncharacterized protein n=1 Tax=Rhizophagus irregularis (strain DAOM 181602 / DAOM 197198 / MUCL 43194) TaxID=747089 RepID=U9TIX9_RHIID